MLVQLFYMLINKCLLILKIPLVLEKEPEVDGMGNPVSGPDGKQKYKCGFRIGGGIDQDNTKSPQGYPDKVSHSRRSHLFHCIPRCALHADMKSQYLSDS